MKLSTTFSRAGRNLPTALMLAAMALVVTACGGGGGSGSMTPQNIAPVVGSLPSITIGQDTPTTPIPFTLADDGAPDALKVTTMSSDSSIVAPDGISVAGSGAARTITVTPNEDAVGRVNISVQAQDAQGAVGMSTLAVNVTAVSKSITSYTNGAFALGENDTPVQVSGFTFVQDADDEATFNPFLQ